MDLHALYMREAGVWDIAVRLSLIPQTYSELDCFVTTPFAAPKSLEY